MLNFDNARMTDIVIRNGDHFIQITASENVDLSLDRITRNGIKTFVEPGGVTVKIDPILYNQEKIFNNLKEFYEGMGYKLCTTIIWLLN